jgi:hexosaminidase
MMNKFSKVKAIIITIAIESLCSISGYSQGVNINDRYPVIPYPTHLIPGDGNFSINNHTKIVVQNIAYKNEANQLIQLIKNIDGFTLQYAHVPGNNCIVLMADSSIHSGEGYHLLITSKQIILSAAGSAGIFWGIETIRQLLPAVEQEKEISSLPIPAADIIDSPAYSWRGMHLDVARHFFSQAYLEKFIDRMALYKLNKLHLHLTDDQGWRIEIKQYPELVKKSAWRTFNGDDSDCMKLAKTNPDFTIDPEHIIHRNGKTLYGGYYTQSQMRDIIKYAAKRHIDIIPEIDMPGHMMAAINAYPFLASADKSENDFSTPICPCKESTFTFAENVFKEIIDLFPVPYIHLGCDEVSKMSWAKSPDCKQLMKQEGLKNVDELQSYFVQRMENFFQAQSKRLIGWDDILEGKIDSTAIVMYWRTWVPNAPIEAAHNGNDVIITPINPLYFDQWPDNSTLYNVYHFNLVPSVLTGAEKDKIIGAQANVWTETIPSEKRVDFMTMPRMTALSEITWTNRKDYEGYLERLKSHYIRWDEMKIHYRLPDLEGFADNNVFTDSTKLIIQKPLPYLIIHYTTDGSIPDLHSPILLTPLPINTSSNIKIIAFTPKGNKGDMYDLKYEKDSLMPAVTIDKALKKGLRCVYYEGSFKSMEKMANSPAKHIYILNNINVPENIKTPSFGLQYRGYIDIPETSIYSFYLTSDHGSKLIIDGKIVVDNDGIHSARERSGGIALQKGIHTFSLDYNERGGIYYSLRLQYGKQRDIPKNIPDVMFKYEE